MREDFKYKLDEGSKKFLCPSCEKKRFVRYVDEVGNYISEKYGRCDREDNCGYFFSPYEDSSSEFTKSGSLSQNRSTAKDSQIEPTFIPKDVFRKSLTGYEKNNFIKFLGQHFDSFTVQKLIHIYNIGTTKEGGTIFYQIDAAGMVRRGKIIFYDAATGRKKYFHSVHKKLGIDRPYPEWRYFGEHLLPYTDLPVALVEAEKTAIIATAYFPQFVWIATGTKSTLKIEYTKSLKNRKVVLFPDIGAYDEWKEKADQLAAICDVSISDLLERKAGGEGKQKGYDLADYLIQFKLESFGKVSPSVTRDKPVETKYESRFINQHQQVAI